MKFALLVAIAACGGDRVVDHAGGSLGDGAHRATPAPSIVWKDHAFVTDTLPAVARAQELVVVPIREIDERGFQNLRLEVRDRGDKTIQTIPVMTGSEADVLAPAGEPTATLTQKIAAANAELVRLHDLHDLVAMKPLDVQTPTDNGFAHLAIGDGLDVDFGTDHLHVFRHNSDRAVVIVPTTSWLVKTSGRCEFPAFVRAVYHAPELSTVVVQIAYRGEDSCTIPSDQFHVVAW